MSTITYTSTPTLFVFQGNFKPVICFIQSANNLHHAQKAWEMAKSLQSIDKVHGRTIRKISAIYSLYPFGCKNGSNEPELIYIKEDKKRNELADKACKATKWLIEHVNSDKKEADSFRIMGLTPQVATFIEAYGILPAFYPEKYPELMQSIEESYAYNRPQMMAWIKTTKEILSDEGIKPDNDKEITPNESKYIIMHPTLCQGLVPYTWLCRDGNADTPLVYDSMENAISDIREDLDENYFEDDMPRPKSMEDNDILDWMEENDLCLFRCFVYPSGKITCSESGDILFDPTKMEKYGR
jgi:hypothetical protein